MEVSGRKVGETRGGELRKVKGRQGRGIRELRVNSGGEVEVW